MTVINVVLFTSGKQSNRHSGAGKIGPLVKGRFAISQSQKHSSLPPVGNPHMGSFSNLYLGVHCFPIIMENFRNLYLKHLL